MTTIDVMKYLKPGAIVPVDMQTTALLVNALREALANEALDKMAENARELGLDYEVEPKIGCVNHDCDKCKALAEQPAQQEIDWKDQYEKQKRRADMWVAKYEADIGPLEKAGPVTAQQEPVAWQYRDARDDGTWGAWLGCDKRLAEDEYRQVRALYTAPQPEPVQQSAERVEPVAVVSGYYGGKCVILPLDTARIFNSNTPLYTSPPAQRTWVGLTDEELSEVYNQAEWQSWCFNGWEYERAIEAKLKEKNCG